MHMHISKYPYIHAHKHVHVHVHTCIHTCYHESSRTQPQLEWKYDASDQRKDRRMQQHHQHHQQHTTPHHTTPLHRNTGVQKTMFMHVTFHDCFLRVHACELPWWFHSANTHTALHKITHGNQGITCVFSTWTHNSLVIAQIINCQNGTHFGKFFFD